MADRFEQSIMRDGTAVRFREKHVQRRLAAATLVLGAFVALLFVAPGVAAIARNGYGALAILSLIGLLLGGLVAALGVAAAVARTVVTETALHVQAGVAIVTIPLASIRGVTPGTRAATRRRARDDLAILAPGTPTVTIRYERDGVERSTCISTLEPDALVAALGARAGGGVRVAPVEQALAADEADVPRAASRSAAERT